MTKVIIEQKRAEYEEQKKTSEFISYVGGKIRACDEILAAIKPCVWTFQQNQMWKTECGHQYTSGYNVPMSTSIKFCEYCGNEIKKENQNEQV